MSRPAGPDNRLAIRLAAPDDVLLRLAVRHPQRYPALFDSAGSGPLARQTLLFRAVGPRLVRNASGQVTGPHADGANFFGALRSWYRAQQAVGNDSWSGGWVVYLGYESAADLEARLQLPQSTDPISALAVYCPIRLRTEPNSDTVEISGESGAQDLIDECVADIESCQEPSKADQSAWQLPVSWREDPEERFLAAVRQAKLHIGAGDIYQANLSRAWRATFAADAAPAVEHVYRRLRTANPGPFAALLQFDQAFAVLSSSPERLLHIEGRDISTRPIAGTRARSRQANADAEEIAALIAHPKERAEHIMLIDLERNDLGRVCEGGSVTVDELLAVESYQHVHHIVSNVRGRLRSGLTPVDALMAVFPGGTITGVPKLRCMQLIAELEREGRGAYTGSVGYIGRDGRSDFNILIRTLVRTNDSLSFRAGAGIVADSDPQRELQETRAKARGLLAALQASQ